VIDLDRIVGFDWDAGNARKNEKHGVSQSEAEQVFFDARLLMVADPSHSGGEARFHALGVTIDGRHLHVTFTLRANETLIRVISARDMHRKERTVYDHET
jgi:uncharacterized DUF497 family protein